MKWALKIIWPILRPAESEEQALLMGYILSSRGWESWCSPDHITTHDDINQAHRKASEYTLAAANYYYVVEEHS